MNNPAEDIKDMLVAYGESSGLDVEFADNLFINREPSLPDNCVTIFDTVGYSSNITLDGSVGYENPSIQIRVRNKKQEDCLSVINTIKDALHGRHQETWNNTLYCIITCSSGPALLDWDDNGCCRLVLNLNVQRR